ncbi:TetR/AcrR family transcriptional regulator [Phenylobacterium sp.]|uniref:TetR/AcrR family transcriptional regulator n=1 Tax=Phenylobacterium sp. TaxID=1871053 RepID=UPI002736A7A8|nr:TetR/AcrR family transcriptional regulator [Phenylobacterium sp.]MDP3634000.1 TetR/AcrR family transcriptional regulator [Phenylobacterium sp.]MDP3853984.1 TetR/AcrR family transcriptional regulator [Phenylobacterium sp.]HQT54283.1 TetR/AcrR family transcriptional regulator [Phenylobacterium sp.]
MPPHERRAQLLDVAAERVLGQGVLPVGVEALAQAAKVSKALIYRYFPEPWDLYNALLERSLEDVAGALDAAVGAPDLATAAGDVADIYYRHVARTGPLIQIILRDRFMVGHVSPRAAAIRAGVAGRLARKAREAIDLDLRETIACLSIGMTMPEECGRLAFQGELDLERGALLCRELVLGVLDVAARRGLEPRG